MDSIRSDDANFRSFMNDLEGNPTSPDESDRQDWDFGLPAIDMHFDHDPRLFAEDDAEPPSAKIHAPFDAEDALPDAADSTQQRRPRVQADRGFLSNTNSSNAPSMSAAQSNPFLTQPSLDVDREYPSGNDPTLTEARSTNAYPIHGLPVRSQAPDFSFSTNRNATNDPFPPPELQVTSQWTPEVSNRQNLTTHEQPATDHSFDELMLDESLENTNRFDYDLPQRIGRKAVNWPETSLRPSYAGTRATPGLVAPLGATMPGLSSPATDPPPHPFTSCATRSTTVCPAQTERTPLPKVGDVIHIQRNFAIPPKSSDLAPITCMSESGDSSTQSQARNPTSGRDAVDPASTSPDAGREAIAHAPARAERPYIVLERFHAPEITPNVQQLNTFEGDVMFDRRQTQPGPTFDWEILPYTNAQTSKWMNQHPQPLQPIYTIGAIPQTVRPSPAHFIPQASGYLEASGVKMDPGLALNTISATLAAHAGLEINRTMIKGAVHADGTTRYYASYVKTKVWLVGVAIELQLWIDIKHQQEGVPPIILGWPAWREFRVHSGFDPAARERVLTVSPPDKGERRHKFYLPLWPEREPPVVRLWPQGESKPQSLTDREKAKEWGLGEPSAAA